MLRLTDGHTKSDAGYTLKIKLKLESYLIFSCLIRCILLIFHMYQTSFPSIKILSIIRANSTESFIIFKPSMLSVFATHTRISYRKQSVTFTKAKAGLPSGICH